MDDQKLSDLFLKELTLHLPVDHLLFEHEDLIPYSFDGTAVLKQLPKAVLIAEKPDEICRAVAIARRHNVYVVTRGSGTRLSGGSVPLAGSLVISLVKMNKVLELDAKNLCILVEAGVITQSVYEVADSVNLFYPPDPGSMRISTIGGNVAENSGGLRGLKYGVTRDYVIGLEVVLPNGDLCWFGGKCVKDVAGYSMRNVFIGSEGTLGIVTKVLLKLLPKPKARETVLATFHAMDDAAETVSDIISSAIVPCTLEFLDQKTITCVEDYCKIGLPLDVAAILLIETDGHPAAVADEALAIENICRKHEATSTRRAKSAIEASQLSNARRSAFSALARRRPTTILEDVTVPRSELAGMIRDVASISRLWNVEIATFGHFGDGNLHPTILCNERDPAEMKRVEHAINDIVEAALKRKGTITGEHGVGLAKKHFLRRQLGNNSYLLMKSLKDAWDPSGLLNPGKIFEAD